MSNTAIQPGHVFHAQSNGVFRNDSLSGGSVRRHEDVVVPLQTQNRLLLKDIQLERPLTKKHAKVANAEQ